MVFHFLQALELHILNLACLALICSSKHLFKENLNSLLKPLCEGPAKAHKRREKSTAVCGIRTLDLLFTFCSLKPRIFEPKCEDCFTFFLIPAKLFCHRALLSQAKKSSFFSHKMIFCKMLSKKGGFLMSFEIKEAFFGVPSSSAHLNASLPPPPHLHTHHTPTLTTHTPHTPMLTNTHTNHSSTVSLYRQVANFFLLHNKAASKRQLIFFSQGPVT